MGHSLCELTVLPGTSVLLEEFKSRPSLTIDACHVATLSLPHSQTPVSFCLEIHKPASTLVRNLHALAPPRPLERRLPDNLSLSGAVVDKPDPTSQRGQLSLQRNHHGPTHVVNCHDRSIQVCRRLRSPFCIVLVRQIALCYVVLLHDPSRSETENGLLLAFNRTAAYGFRLAAPAGAAVRFEPRTASGVWSSRNGSRTLAFASGLVGNLEAARVK